MGYNIKNIEETACVEYPNSVELQKAYINGFTDAYAEQGMSDVIDENQKQELQFYCELIDYLSESPAINYQELFETLSGDLEHRYFGKLHGTKYIDDKGDLWVDIQVDDKIHFKAKWDFSSNSGVSQWIDGATCDCYSGFVILPTLLDDVFFVYYYRS